MFKALNIAILELDHEFILAPHDYPYYQNWEPLWNNPYPDPDEEFPQIYHPQDFLPIQSFRKSSKTSKMGHRRVFTKDFFHSTSLLPWGSKIKIFV